MAQLRYAIPILTILVLTSLKPSQADDSKTAAKYRDLVKQLVSPNTAPMLGQRFAEGTVKLPADYDVASQRKIAAARKELHEHIEEALPYLVEALDDNRYCMTVGYSELTFFYNRTVGDICREVIASHLEIYQDKIEFSGPSHWHYYDYTPISKDWWIKRKDRRLVELQIEAIDWAIKKRKNEPEHFRPDDDNRANEVAALIELRDEIAESKTPEKPGRMTYMVTRNIPTTK